MMLQSRPDRSTERILLAITVSVACREVYWVHFSMNVNYAGQNGFTALHYAAQSDRRDLTTLLLSPRLTKISQPRPGRRRFNLQWDVGMMILSLFTFFELFDIRSHTNLTGFVCFSPILLIWRHYVNSVCFSSFLIDYHFITPLPFLLQPCFGPKSDKIHPPHSPVFCSKLCRTRTAAAQRTVLSVISPATTRTATYVSHFPH